jgi:hypothetical protein
MVVQVEGMPNKASHIKGESSKREINLKAHLAKFNQLNGKSSFRWVSEGQIKRKIS